MMKHFACFALSMMCLFANASSVVAANVPSKPTQLTCEALVKPLGMDDPKPELSWVLQDPRTGAAQSAYQIQVASSAASLASGKADVWDSGRVASNQSVHVSYAGSALAASKRYFWRVKVWDQNGK